MHGSYEALHSGNNGDALTDFTGGLVESYSLYEPPPNLSGLFSKAFCRRSLIGASIYEVEENVDFPSGLPAGHAYSVTAMEQVTVEKQIVNLVRVRNPWGNDVEWEGAWSDRSKEWQMLSPDERDRMGLIDRPDGEFWMDVVDFQRYFHDIDVCNMTPDALIDPPKTWTVSVLHSQWTRKDRTAGGSVQNASFWRNPQFHLRVDDSEEDPDDLASFIVELMQKDRRKNRHLGYSNLRIGFIIYRIGPGVVLPLRNEYCRQHQPAVQVNSYINARSAVQRFTLPAGEYVIIPSTWKPEKEAKFTVRVFSEATHEINLVDNSEDNDVADGKSGHSGSTDNEDPTIRSLGQSLVGRGKETDAVELKKCLDYAVAHEGFGHLQFKYSTCKYLIIMMDADDSGKLAFSEFLVLWTTLKQWLKTFVGLDKDKKGTIPASELPTAFQILGYDLDPRMNQTLVYRYADGNDGVVFNKYIKCAAKVRMLLNRFRAGPQIERTLDFNFSQWLKTGSVL